MLLLSFAAWKKLEKFGFLIFLGCIKKDQSHGMGLTKQKTDNWKQITEEQAVKLLNTGGNKYFLQYTLLVTHDVLFG